MISDDPSDSSARNGPVRLSSPLYPALLSILAAAHGYRTGYDPRDCDIALIGEGSAEAAALLAAANPGCRIWLLDCPQDASRIAQWQQDIGLANLSRVDNSLDDLSRLLLPPLALILIRDLPNTLNPDAMRAVLDWCSRALTPGGLLHLDYDALPGAAALTVLRDICQAVSEPNAAPQERTQQALAYLAMLDEQQAPMLQAHGSIRTVYRHLLQASPSARQRRLFAPVWTPRHLTALSADCEASGFTFVGSTARMLSAEAAQTAAELADSFATATDPLSLEQHLCFAMDCTRGGDLYALTDSGHEDFPADLYGLVSAHDERNVPGDPIGQIAVERLIAAENFLPKPRAGAPVAPALRHNAMAALNAVNSNARTTMVAAPALGGGLRLTTMDALWLTARAAAGDDGAPGWARDRILELGKRIQSGDRDVGESDMERVLNAVFQAASERLPEYARYGLTAL